MERTGLIVRLLHPYLRSLGAGSGGPVAFWSPAHRTFFIMKIFFRCPSRGSPVSRPPLRYAGKIAFLKILLVTVSGRGRLDESRMIADPV